MTPEWFKSLRGFRLFGLKSDGETPKELTRADGSGDPALKTVSENGGNPSLSSYSSVQSIGTTAVAFKYPSGSKGLMFKVKHATQSIQIGEGIDESSAKAKAPNQFAYLNSDGLQKVARRSNVDYFALLGSDVNTDIQISVI